mmetsp:Transcript_50216/g.162720  ORF Transcript_50216/g.162720 Transcript_50216/m.162720 type:complete len:212 (+) Transcript_50216:308-943(+)
MRAGRPTCISQSASSQGSRRTRACASPPTASLAASPRWASPCAPATSPPPPQPPPPTARGRRGCCRQRRARSSCRQTRAWSCTFRTPSTGPRSARRSSSTRPRAAPPSPSPPAAPKAPPAPPSRCRARRSAWAPCTASSFLRGRGTTPRAARWAAPSRRASAASCPSRFPFGRPSRQQPSGGRCGRRPGGSGCCCGTGSPRRWPSTLSRLR